jgi:hypothetical protein
MAAAAAAAGAFFQIGGHRQPAQFNRLGNMFLDGTLDRVQFFLRVEETARHGIAQQRLAVFFKVGNFRRFQHLAVMLFFLERLAFVHQRFILAARAVVGHERLDALADGDHFRLGDDGLAKFLCLFLDGGCHKK